MIKSYWPLSLASSKKKKNLKARSRRNKIKKKIKNWYSGSVWYPSCVLHWLSYFTFTAPCKLCIVGLRFCFIFFFTLLHKQTFLNLLALLCIANLQHEKHKIRNPNEQWTKQKSCMQRVNKWRWLHFSTRNFHSIQKRFDDCYDPYVYDLKCNFISSVQYTSFFFACLSCQVLIFFIRSLFDCRSWLCLPFELKIAKKKKT